MSQDFQGANIIWMGKNRNLLFLCLMWMHCTLQGCCLQEDMCLPIPVQGNTLPHLVCWRWSIPRSELTRLRPKIQDSSWMPWWEDVCFEGVSSHQHLLCVYQCCHYRGSSEAMWGRFQVVLALTEACTMVRASVQWDEVLNDLIQPLFTAGELD